MAGESTHSSSGAEEDRELPHVREGWEEEREQEEGEGEARRDQGEPRKLGKPKSTCMFALGDIWSIVFCIESTFRIWNGNQIRCLFDAQPSEWKKLSISSSSS